MYSRMPTISSNIKFRNEVPLSDFGGVLNGAHSLGQRIGSAPMKKWQILAMNVLSRKYRRTVNCSLQALARFENLTISERALAI